MELAFGLPELRALDDLGAEVLVASLWEDVRPLRGVLGLVDYRMLGRVSELARSGFVRGVRGELTMLPARPRLAFDKLLVVGMGARDGFDAAQFHAAFDRARSTLETLKIKRAVVELPGRFDLAASAKDAASAMFRAQGGETCVSAYTWLEPEAEQAAIAQSFEEEHRRARRG